MGGPECSEVLVHQVVERVAELNPSKAAILWLSGDGHQEGHIITYAQVNRYSYVLSSLLGEVLELVRSCWDMPEAAQQHVAILVDEGPEIVMSELAVLKCRSVFVPIDPTWPDARIAYILRDSSARVALVLRAACRVIRNKLVSEGMDVFVIAESCERVEASAKKEGGKTSRALVLVVVEDVLEGSVDGGCDGLREFLNADGKQRAETGRESCVDGDDMEVSHLRSHIIYTSGTTGEPKGVVCEHRGLLAYMQSKALAHEIDSNSRVLLAAAITWDPSLGDIFSTLAQAALLCIAPRASLTTSLLDVLVQGRVTHVCTTPALWGLLDGSVSAADLPHLRVLALGGAALTASIVAKWSRALRLINTYGVTEATVYQTWHVCDGREEDEFKVVGRPFKDVLVKVEGDEGEGGAVEGEILVGGVQVACGYLRRDELTRSKFFEDDQQVRWFRTGDVGRWRRRGGGGKNSDLELEVLGRIDFQVKLRGFRIELQEIESVISRCSFVEGVVVVKVGSESSERLVAYLSVREKRGEAARRMMEHGGEVCLRLLCLKYMPQYHVPSQFVLLEGGLPLSSNGKVDRNSLPPPPPLSAQGAKSSGTEAGQQAGEESLRTELEELVSEIWSQVLQLEGPLGPMTNFFEMGGNSVSAVRMLGMLEQGLSGVEFARLVGTSSSLSTPADRSRVRLCGLHRKPRLREFALFLQWTFINSPTLNTQSKRSLLQWHGVEEDSGGLEGAEEMLARMEDEMSVRADVLKREAAALELAVGGNQEEVVSSLLSLCASPDGAITRFNKGSSPLMRAVARGNLPIVRLLLSAGASLSLVNGAHLNAAHLAAAGGHAEILSELLDAGEATATGQETRSIVNARDLSKWSLLHHASFHGQEEVTAALLSRGVEVNLKDRWGRTPLSYAASMGHPGVMRLLLEHGAGLHEGGERNRKQPQLARQRRLGNSWCPVLSLVVENYLSSNGKEGEYSAILSQLIELRERLLISVDDQDVQGWTALHFAAMARPERNEGGEGGKEGEKENDKRANELEKVSGQGVDGAEGLRTSGCEDKEWEKKLEFIIRSLTQANADVNRTTKDGETPMDLALRVENDVAVRLLRPFVPMPSTTKASSSSSSSSSPSAAATQKQISSGLRETHGSARKGGEGAGVNDRRNVSWIEQENIRMGATFFVPVTR